MTPPLTSVTTTLLEKAAVDNGFDQELPPQGDWLGFASTQAPLRLWLSTFGDALFIAALSQQNVAAGLARVTTAHRWRPRCRPALSPAGRLLTFPPCTASCVERSSSRKATPRRTPPRLREEDPFPTQDDRRRTADCPTSRPKRLPGLAFWNTGRSRCAITGLAVAELLRASHIKPWADCSHRRRAAGRLQRHLARATTRCGVRRSGSITLADDGTVIVSSEPGRRRPKSYSGLEAPLRARTLHDSHRRYLPWHRERVFKAGNHSGPWGPL